MTQLIQNHKNVLVVNCMMVFILLFVSVKTAYSDTEKSGYYGNGPTSIQESSGVWLRTQMHLFAMTPKLLPAPGYVSPANGTFLMDNTPELNWTQVPNAKGYQLLVDNSSAFTSPEVVELFEGNVDYYNLPSSLADGKYFWKLRTINESDVAGPFRIPWYFIVDTTAPAIPKLYKPSNLSLVKGTPTFYWHSVSGAKFYQFRITKSDDINFDHPIWLSPDTLTSISYKPPLLNPGEYLWTVQVRDVAGNWSGWASPRTITILNGIPPAPILDTPVNGSSTFDMTPTFKWQPAIYAQKYQVMVDTNNCFTSPYTLLQYSEGGALEYTSTTNLKNGQYYWRVRGINEYGEAGFWSSYRIFSVDTNIKPPKPLAPTNVIAQPTGEHSVTLTWTNQDNDADNIRIERSLDGGNNWQQLDPIPNDQISFKDEGLSCDAQYDYRLRTYRFNNGDPLDDYSDYTPIVSTRTNLCTLVAPSDLSATARSITEIDLSWTYNQPGGDVVAIEHSPNGTDNWEFVDEVSANQTRYLEDGLTCDTPYFYRVYTRDTLNNRRSEASANIAQARTFLCPLLPPINVTLIQSTNSSVQFSWTNQSSNGSSILIERSDNGTYGWVEIATSSGSDTQFNDEQLSCNSDVYYRLRAYRQADMSYSEYSQVFHAQTTDCSILFHDDFSTNKNWVNQSDGNIYRDTNNDWIVWSVSRNTTRRFYHAIAAPADGVQLTFRYRVTGYGGNGSVSIGLVEDLDTPVQFGEVDATGVFVRIFHFGDFGGASDYWAGLLANFRDAPGYQSEQSDWISQPGINVWRKASLIIDNRIWTLVILDDADTIIGQQSGVLPERHSAFNYVFLGFDQVGGWEWENGLFDDVYVRTYVTTPDP